MRGQFTRQSLARLVRLYFKTSDPWTLPDARLRLNWGELAGSKNVNLLWPLWPIEYNRISRPHPRSVPLAPGCTRPWGNEERSSWMQSNGNGDKAKPQFRRHLRCTNRMVKCLETQMGSMEACWMLDDDWWWLIMWEHVGTNSCYVKLMFCLLDLLVSYGSYMGPTGLANCRCWYSKKHDRP